MNGSESKPEKVIIRGEVQRVFHAQPRFTAGLMNTLAGNEIRFAARFFVSEHDRVVFHGRWVKHPKFGLQLDVEAMEYDLTLDKEGLANYLANHPKIKGVGPVKAKNIADRFSRNWDLVITNQPEAVAKVAKLPLSTVETIRTVWQEAKTKNQAMTLLAKWGLTHHQVTTLVDKYGNGIIGLLKSDPYIIIRDLTGFGFKQVDQIALKAGTAKNDPARIRAALHHCVNNTIDHGDCWIEFDELLEEASALLFLDERDSSQVIEKELNELISQEELSCSSLAGRLLVARPDIYKAENGLADTISNFSLHIPHFENAEETEKMISVVAPGVNAGQHKAVLTALTSPISLITGGAGSGKSYTVSALTDIYEEAGLQVVLAAPTGKAAKRLEEISGRSASTLHRLLGFNGEEFGFGTGPDELQQADVVIVDEVSMVDIPLAWQLFQIIDLKKTTVVLVGDHNQLPAVGPGNFLRDLIQTEIIPTVVLEEVIRQAGALKENSIAVLQGEVRKTSQPESSGRRAWYVIDHFNEPLEVKHFLLEMFDNILLERLGYNLLNQVQVLTPTHKGPLGTRDLNIALQRLIQQKFWNIEIPSVPIGRKPKLHKHDRVIQTRNNYELEVMNGTLGHVIQVERDGSIKIDFDGNQVNLKAGSPYLKDIQLAYALTIHKVQGSEFRCAIIITHKSHSFMHHCNLLYTGVTRAKETAIILGDAIGIQNCAKRHDISNRNTFLPLLLTGQVSPTTA